MKRKFQATRSAPLPVPRDPKVMAWVLLRITDAREDRVYNSLMQRKIFWTAFAALGLLADVVLPLWWAVAATLPILYVSWWIAYRSDWF